MPATFRISEVARRTGISVDVLRAWERRYGLPNPARAPGGFRLYSDQDIAAVRAMQALLDEGVSPAEAARSVAAGGAPTYPSVGLAAEDAQSELLTAIERFDEPALHDVLDRLLADRTVESVLREVVVPLLNQIGTLWERAELTVAHEHFASNVIRGRLLGLARGWARGTGPHALLACPGDEQHDLALIAFGIALNRLGWRIAYLGAAAPVETIARAADAVRPALVVLALTMAAARDEAGAIVALTERSRVAVAGRAATPAFAAASGAELLDADPVTAAELVALGPPPATTSESAPAQR